jgi:excisionase family DNA binding protein
MTTAEAARLLNVSARQVRNLIDAGRIRRVNTSGAFHQLDPRDIQKLARQKSGGR